MYDQKISCQIVTGYSIITGEEYIYEVVSRKRSLNKIFNSSIDSCKDSKKGKNNCKNRVC